MLKKRTIGLIGLIGTLGVVAVGSAAWVITNTATKTETGTVTVDTVTDKRVTLTTSVTDETAILAGKPAGTSTSVSWLDTDQTEDLTLVVEYTVDYVDVNITDNSKITVTATTDASTQLGSLVSSNYIKINDLVVTTPNASSGVGTVTLTFAWGTAFGGENPFEYYNKLTYSEENVGAAKSALKALEAFGSKTITFTITAKASA